MRMTRGKIITALFLILTLFLFGCGKEEEEAPSEAYEEETAPAISLPGKEAEEPDSREEEKKELSLEDKIKAMHITYRFDGASEELDGETISGWLETMSDGSVSVNEASAKEYVASLAS